MVFNSAANGPRGETSLRTRRLAFMGTRCGQSASLPADPDQRGKRFNASSRMALQHGEKGGGVKARPVDPTNGQWPTLPVFSVLSRGSATARDWRSYLGIHRSRRLEFRGTPETLDRQFDARTGLLAWRRGDTSTDSSWYRRR